MENKIEAAKVETKLEQRIIRAPSHTKYYVTNVRGGRTDADFRFELLNEKVQSGDNPVSWDFISDSMIILTPVGAKRLFELLKLHLEVYENECGKIDIEAHDKHLINMSK